MSFADRNADLIAKYTQANAEVMTAWFAANTKFLSLGMGGAGGVTASDPELTRLNTALQNRMAIDREMVGLIQEAFTTAAQGKGLG